ncbi:hypothetical protein [Rhodohalobacter sp. 614A]|uniref:hypothetical protein n=1 Tax=Rhodohalobacter sp. 614A TaxID=2908649 RepID=UPI001F2C091C|nr:hypothetical protein [Rhodohalobacter sp. 614A]
MKTWHWIVLGVLALITLILEFTVLADYHHHWWNSIPLFYGIYGFLGCIVTIFLAKGLGKLFIFRNEGYYDR